MSHLPSFSFAWTSTINQEYLEKNNSCCGDLFENVAARFSYPGLALAAIIETVGIAVAAVFSSLTLLVPCGVWGERKASAFNLWKRSALSAAALTLDVLGFFSPWLTSKTIDFITQKFFPIEKEKGKETPSAFKKREPSPPQSEEESEAPLTDDPSDNYGGSIVIHEDVDETDPSTAAFTTVKESEVNTDEIYQKWRDETLSPLVKRIAAEVWLHIFATEPKVEESLITNKIDASFKKITRELKDKHSTVIQQLLDLKRDSLQKEIKKDFEEIFWRLKVLLLLPVDESQKVALAANLPKLISLLREIDTLFRSRINGDGEIATLKERAIVDAIFKQYVKKVGGPLGERSVFVIPTKRIIQAAKKYLEPWKKENDQVTKEAIEHFDEWVKERPGYNPKRPPSMREIGAWSLRSKKMSMNPKKHRNEIDTALQSLTSPESAVAIDAQIAAKASWIEKYKEAQSRVENEHRLVATILSLNSYLQLDETAYLLDFQRGVALLENLPKLHQLYQSTIERVRTVLDAEKPTETQIKQIARSIFNSCVKEDACSEKANLSVPQERINQDALPFLQVIRKQASPKNGVPLRVAAIWQRK